jgi:diaminopimelate epimerase
VLIENSDIADAKMRIFNATAARQNGRKQHTLRCKYLYDKGIVKKETMEIETNTGVKACRLYIATSV